MAKVGRNERCPCGSGRKVKRCCAHLAGPSPEAAAASYLERLARESALTLLGIDEATIDALADELCDLPLRHTALLVPLPRLRTPALERLCRAAAGDDSDEIVRAVTPVLPTFNTSVTRARLAETVVALRDSGALDGALAALALVDLAAFRSDLLAASLIHSAAVSAGAVPTAGGLVVAR
jgi:hypothetical protein